MGWFMHGGVVGLKTITHMCIFKTHTGTYPSAASEKTYSLNASASGKDATRAKGVGSCGAQRRAAGAESRCSGLFFGYWIDRVRGLCVGVLVDDPERGGKGLSYIRYHVRMHRHLLGVRLEGGRVAGGGAGEPPQEGAGGELR